MEGISLKQFQRTYPGNYKFNFIACLSGVNDFKNKNYSNFYLTNNYKFSDTFNIDSSKLKAKNINTTIKYGNVYLKFQISDSTLYSRVSRYEEYSNYGKCSFTEDQNDRINFNVVIKDNNMCQIYHTYDYKNYYMVADTNNKISFVKKKLLTFDENTINPQDFKYLWSEDQKSIQLFKSSTNGEFFITKSGNKLIMYPIQEDAITTYISQPPFKLERSIYTYPNISLNSSFIKYNNSNTINYEESEFNLKNNFLLHKNYNLDNSPINIIPLKNQLCHNDVYTSGNNLLYGSTNNIYVDDMRVYSSISQDIREETSDELSINYVYYNQSYKIKPGYNFFKSPSNMYPFEILNINDTKFINAGSFSFDTPQYADKIYKLSKEPQNLDNGQYMLCTWLSGSPSSIDKVWVDRYYYPDRIDKKNALSQRLPYEFTYDDYIEKLINNNSDIKNSVDSRKFFDKLSDMTFTPNQEYSYERINSINILSLSSDINMCQDYVSNYPTNYFTKINKSNKFTVAFYFLGDTSSWIVKSDTNAIECGLYIEKLSDLLHIKYQLFDPSDGIYLTFETKQQFKKLKNNFVCVSIDAISGVGYFFLNDEIVQTFNTPIYQYVKKQLVYGDFYVIKEFNKTNILIYSGNDINNPFVSDEFTDQNLTFILPILNGKTSVDDIYITLPCGMRNGVDDIEHLQSVCGSSSFKSNNVNVIVKNLNISNVEILKGVESSIKTSIKHKLPINTKVVNVKFNDYKSLSNNRVYEDIL